MLKMPLAKRLISMPYLPIKFILIMSSLIINIEIGLRALIRLKNTKSRKK